MNVRCISMAVLSTVAVAVACRHPDLCLESTFNKGELSLCDLCCPDGVGDPYADCDHKTGTGICISSVADCVCDIGETASGPLCACISAQGPGRSCEVTSDCGDPVTYECLGFATDTRWKNGAPPGRVCVPKRVMRCDMGGNVCTSPDRKCVFLKDDSSSGRCASTCPNGQLCRFDEITEIIGDSCTCKRRDPIGSSCDPRDGNELCNWLEPLGNEPKRTCQVTEYDSSSMFIQGTCLPGGTCDPQDGERCNNMVGKYCGAIVECDGRCSKPDIPDLGNECGCGGTVTCNGCNRPGCLTGFTCVDDVCRKL